MTIIQNYSVLMSVYKNENPEFLQISMESIYNQTLPTNDFVLVCDGALNEGLDNVIWKMQRRFGDILRVVRLSENYGLGKALQIGIELCKNDIIARMDSDDISCPNRCEKELDILLAHPEISIVGSNIKEFTSTPDTAKSERTVPEYNNDILNFAKTRNPFNHPSVMYRKKDVLAAGNYQDVRYMQDYYLWIHMLIHGFKGYNIQEPLVYMRAPKGLFKRRSGKLYMQLQLKLFKYMRDVHFITYPQYLKSCFLRICSALAPNSLREYIFKKFLRNSR